ncbi:MAG: methyltransferase domain-containing protein [Actinomycetota bacterium]|nr:methyltransferase domain-containing protein [Actinomycetota bacterium]
MKRTQLRRMLDRIAPAAPGGDFIELAHRNVFGSPTGLVSRRRYAAILEEDGGRLGVLTRMLAEPGHADKVVAELDPVPGLSDEAFVSWAYQTLLDREADPEGLRRSVEDLAGGSTRADIVRRMVRSDEYRQRAVARYFPLVDLRRLRPERYDEIRHPGADPAVVFRAEEPEDFDWMESAILDGGYYDKPGVWGFGIDTDKRLMAEVVSSLEPATVLELGCASGPVLQCLHDMGVDAEGVEISAAAIDSAFPDVRGRIHQVNATDFELPSSYDVIFGLDIFEHLNPNRLGDCLQRIESHLNRGGYVFCNIPAFGPDPVFGQVFPVYIESWVADAECGTHFRTLHCDTLGYPLNGHLIWAHTDWWVGQFEATGLRRQAGIEAALHLRYDAYLERATPARRSFYVFSKDAPPADVARIEAAIRAAGSAVLAALR